LPPARPDRILYRGFGAHGSKGALVANHLTPEELSKELGIERDEVIRICVE
jgi:hypothetical protein